jgi:hypothetical protein
VHDLFEILGLPSNAPAKEVRRACARRPRRLHPDFHDAGPAAAEPNRGSSLTPRPLGPPGDDLAIDFVDASAFNDSIQVSFFEEDGVRS